MTSLRTNGGPVAAVGQLDNLGNSFLLPSPLHLPRDPWPTTNNLLFGFFPDAFFQIQNLLRFPIQKNLTDLSIYSVNKIFSGNRFPLPSSPGPSPVVQSTPLLPYFHYTTTSPLQLLPLVICRLITPIRFLNTSDLIPSQAQEKASQPPSTRIRNFLIPRSSNIDSPT